MRGRKTTTRSWNKSGLLERRRRSILAVFFRPRFFFPTSLFLFYLAFFSLPLSCFAYFQRWGGEAQARGAGDAVTGWWGDPAFAPSNPAGAWGIDQFSLHSSWGRLYAGLSDGSTLGEGSVLAGGPLGGWHWTGGWQSRSLFDALKEDVVFAGTAFRMEGLPGTWGIAVKWYRVERAETVSSLANTSLQSALAQGMGWSVGGQWALMPELTVGLSALDVGAPSLSFVGEAPAFPPSIRIGLGWELGDGWRTGTDAVLRAPLTSLLFGVEKRFTEWPGALRAGGGATVGGAGSVQWDHLDAGATFQWEASGVGRLALHYSWTLPLAGLNGASSHRVSLGFLQSAPLPVTLQLGERLKQIDVLPPQWLVGRVDMTPAEEYAFLQREAGARPSASQLHRLALLAMVTGDGEAGAKYYEGLLGASKEFEPVAVQAVHRLHFALTLDALRQAYHMATVALLTMNLESPAVPADAWLAYGAVSAMTDQWDEADRAFSAWMNTAGAQDAAGWYNAVLTALQRGRPAEALERLGRLKASGVDTMWTEEAAGRVYLALERPAEAVVAFEKARVLSQDHPRERFLLGVAYSRQGEWDRALVLFQEVSRLEEGTAYREAIARETEWAIGQFIQEGGKAELKKLWLKALEWYRKAQALAPQRMDIVKLVEGMGERVQKEVQQGLQRAQAALGEENPLQALREWKEVLGADPQQPDALKLFADTYAVQLRVAQDRLEEGGPAEALRLIKELQRLDGRSEEAKRARQRVYDAVGAKAGDLAMREQFTEARALWRPIVKDDPQDTVASEAAVRLSAAARAKAVGWLEQAKKNDEAGQFLGAASAIQEALRVDPEFAEGKSFQTHLEDRLVAAVKKSFEKASAAVAASKYEEARRHLDEVLRVYPDPQHPSHQTAKRMLAELGRTAKSRTDELWSRAKQADADGKPQDAVETLKQLIKVAPDRDDAEKLLRVIQDRLAKGQASVAEVKRLVIEGDIAYGSGKLTQALEVYQKALDLDYYDLAKTDVRRKIDDVRRELK